MTETAIETATPEPEPEVLQRSSSPSRGRVAVPWWLGVLGAWLAARAVTTALMLFFASREPATFWAGAHPQYLRFAQFWDSGWFHTIQSVGYPAVVPVDGFGHVLGNAWAFMPAYPAVVGLVMAPTGLPWDVASVAVSVACSLGAALLVARLAQAVLGRSSLFPVAVFCFAPLAPIFQVAYAESMTVLLLAALLLLLVRRRYAAMIPLIVLVDLTRPVAVPLAMLLGVHLASLLVRRPRPAPRSLVAAAATTTVAVIGAVLWPVVAWLATGDRNAYLRSELAWRRLRLGSTHLVPFEPWIHASAHWGIGIAGPLLLLAAVVGLAVMLVALPAVRRLGFDLRVWLAVYGAYLLAVFDPQSSTFRMLVPMFPLVLATAGLRSPVARAALLTACVAGQALWIAATWAKWHILGWAPP